MPNVGKATAGDLLLLGIRSVKHLASQKPMKLYERLCVLQETRVDPCMIDVLMSVVEHAQTGIVKDWWEYTPVRKQMLAAAKAPGRKSRVKRESPPKRHERQTGS